MNIYFIATFLHACHVLIGIFLIGTMMCCVLSADSFVKKHFAMVELSGLYWHLVDVIWIFLYPLLYLAR